MRKVILFAGISSAIWGASFPVTKFVLDGVSPILLAVMRYSIASALFLIIFIKLDGKFAHVHKFIPLALFGASLPILFQNFALLYTHAYISGFLQSTGPIYTLFLAFIFLKEKITITKLGGLALAIIGTYLIANPDAMSLIGNILMLLSALFYSIGGIMAKNMLNRGYNWLQTITFTTLLGTLFLLPFLPFEHVMLETNANTVISVIYLALFPTFVAYMLWYNAMEKIEISKLSFYVYMIPVFTIIFSVLILGEEVSLLKIAYGFLIIAGIAIAQKA